jgi:hypothetical protein
MRGALLLAALTLTGCAGAAAVELPLAAGAPTVVPPPRALQADLAPPAPVIPDPAPTVAPAVDPTPPTPIPTRPPAPSQRPVPRPSASVRPARVAPARTPAARTVTAAAPLHAQSANWSGYVESGSFWQVSGAWTEPEVRCTAPDATLALWVGLGGDGSLPLYQAGSGAMCRNGVPVHFLWYELLTDAAQPPQVIVRQISPGDAVAISVDLRGPGGGLIQLADRTSAWSTSVPFSPQTTTLDSAEWIAEATTTPSTGVITPLADFGSVQLGGCTANRGADGLAAAPAGRLVALTLADVSGGGASPGAAVAGGAFTVTYGR